MLFILFPRWHVFSVCVYNYPNVCAHSHTNKHLRHIQLSTSGQRARGWKCVAELKMATLALLRVAAGVALLLQV